MKQNRTALLIGLAMRAGRIAGGETAAEAALRGKEAALVILSEDASANTQKKFSHLAHKYQVPLCRFLGKAALGRAVGRGERSCLVVTDKAFAETILQQINGNAGVPENTGKVVDSVGKYQDS